MWQELSENLAGLVSLYRSEDFFESFQAFMRSLYAKQMELLNQMGGDPDEEEIPVEFEDNKKEGKLDPLVKIFLRKKKDLVSFVLSLHNSLM